MIIIYEGLDKFLDLKDDNKENFLKPETTEVTKEIKKKMKAKFNLKIDKFKHILKDSLIKIV
jgi:hypothetical protein